MPNFVCTPTRIARVLHPALIALVAICCLAVSASAQTTVTLSTPGTHVNADLHIQGGAAGWTDFSSADGLASKVSSDAYTRRMFFKFDTQNYIPANAVIQSAYLYLVLKHAESGENRPFTAYHVTKSFVKYETNWYQFRNGQAWSTPGGDFGQNFGTTYVGGAVGSAYRFDLTALVQATVNGQLGSRYTRFALVDTGGRSSGNYKEFYSTRSGGSVTPQLVITYGGGSGGTSTAPPPQPQQPPPTSSTTLRVMQWNVKKTKGSDGVCNPDRVADTIVAQNPDVVSLNEVNFFSGACAYTFDMGAHIESLLEQKTGVNWHRKHVNVYGGTSGYGNVLLSRLPVQSSDSTLLSFDRGVARMTVYVGGKYVNVFSTHVDYYNSSWRTQQITEAVRWAGWHSEPRIVMGDFNTWPGTSDYNLLAQPYEDAWVAGQNAGTASSWDGSGATHGSSRFDYVFYSRVSTLSLLSVTVPDTRVNGVWPSDHAPVIAVFRVN